MAPTSTGPWKQKAWVKAAIPILGFYTDSRSVQYEFQCQTRSNEEFQIYCRRTGRLRTSQGPDQCSTVNIHIPAQIWDLSATLSGPMNWSDAPETIAQSAQTFCDSLYVLPGSEEAALYFRPPNDREIKIRNLIVKRVSYHSSNGVGNGKGVSLKVTEAKNLQFRVHTDDKTLWMAYEPVSRDQTDYQLQLADAGRIHYDCRLFTPASTPFSRKTNRLRLAN